ncbi:hypothetical protein ACFFRR_003155, partial [Megaselia abdita]
SHHQSPIDKKIYDEICRKCFKVSHNRRECLSIEQAVVACSSCYRMHFFTTNCVCNSPVIDPGQCLRMCGEQICRPFMDVVILTMPLPALINTTLTQTKIDKQVARHILSLQNDTGYQIPREMEVPFTIGERTLILNCEIANFEEKDIHIHLGMDFLLQQRLRMKSENVKLYGHSRWVTNHPYEVQFAYNTPQGQHLNRNLEVLNYPMLPAYRRPNLPDGSRRKYFSRFRDTPRR